MKLASKFMIFSLVMLLSISSVFAQPKHGHHNMSPEDRAKKHTERMTEQLGLSDAQANKVYQINLNYGNKRKALFENAKDKETAKADMKQLRNDQKAAIEAVLTPTQISKMETLKAERKGRGKGHHKGGTHHKMSPEKHAEVRTQKMTEQLGLSSSQATKVQSILLDFGNRRKAIFDNSTDRETAKASVKQLKEGEKAAIEAVLTPVQLQKLEALKAERKAKKGERKGLKRGEGQKK